MRVKSLGLSLAVARRLQRERGPSNASIEELDGEGRKPTP